MLHKTIAKTLLGVCILGSSLLASGEVNVYSHRHYDTDKQLFKMFEEKTGIKVNVVKAKASALIKRMISEGKNSPADVLITVDAGRLFQAKTSGILQSVSSDVLAANIPANLRDKDNQWFGLTKRARVALLSFNEAKKSDIKTYEDLADPKNKGKVVIRSSSNIYNQSLMAAMIEHHGEAYALTWAKGVVANMARTPKGNDRAQIMAVAAGEADIAVANTYYLALMLSGKKGPEQQEAAKKVKAFFPNQNDRGTHMNISCAALVKGAPNKANAIKLVEFLLTPESQEHFVNNTFEFPMIDGVSANPLVVNNIGLDFKQDLKTKVSSYGDKQADALEVMTAAGWK